MTSRKITRREFLKGAAAGVVTAAAVAFTENLLAFPFIKNTKISKKVLVLGIDGMDPDLLKRFISDGSMPTFAKLVASGRFSTLQTSLPPQSPVAWSSFITGSNPGKHGIYDFIARDPKTFTPYLSTSRTFAPSKNVSIGKWQMPLKSGHVELLRKGTPFWSYLERQDIPVVLSQLPANFPVQQSPSKALSGMGTPDILGGYGTDTVFSELNITGSEKFTGTRVVRVRGANHVFKTTLAGPANSFRADGKSAEVLLTISRDPWEQVAQVVLQDNSIILKVGEWSEWLPVRFELVPLAASCSGMVRLYLQSAHPYLKLYCSPINFDPFDPALPISSPPGYAKELAEKLGRYYTQGFPEDTKALSNGIFIDEEFITQAKYVLSERRAALDYELQNFKEGVLFFYFSSVDQCSHMLLRANSWDQILSPSDNSRNSHLALRYIYQQMDEVLRQALGAIDNDTTLLVISDHGFAPFKREINLSTWLAESGYTAFDNPEQMYSTDLYEHVYWAHTKAYVLGINSIYLNLKGREENGSLEPKDADAVKKEIITKLLEIKDPLSGEKVIHNAYDSQKAYWGPEVPNAPDIIVGYSRGYRISDEAVLGKFPRGIVVDRANKWAADHCMDSSLVPGVLLSNKDIAAPIPGLWDVAPTILQQFGIAAPAEMDGKGFLKV